MRHCDAEEAAFDDFFPRAPPPPVALPPSCLCSTCSTSAITSVKVMPHCGHTSRPLLVVPMSSLPPSTSPSPPPLTVGP